MRKQPGVSPCHSDSVIMLCWVLAVVAIAVALGLVVALLMS